jgi:hypothetical protein
MNAAERFAIAQRIKLAERHRPRLVTETVREKYPPNQPRMLCAACRGPVSDRKPLTDRQAEVLAFIRSVIEARGVCPMHDEIAEHFGFTSTASVWWHVNALVRKGWLIRSQAHQKQNLQLADGR